MVCFFCKSVILNTRIKIPVCALCRDNIPAWEYKMDLHRGRCPVCKKQKLNGKNSTTAVCNACLINMSMTHRKIKARIVEYLGGKCQACEAVYEELEVYDVHHLHGKDTPLKIRKPWDTLVKELDGCVLLCANCHRITHSKKY